MKHERQAGFGFLLEALIFIAVVGLLGAAFFVVKNGKGLSLFSSTPACTASSYLTDSPIELSNLPAVFPLGNINAPTGHIFPSDHIGLSVPRIENQINPGQFATAATDIHAPGTVLVHDIKKTIYYKNGQLTQTDFSISFSLCRNVEFYFGHVHSLSGTLGRTVDASAGKCESRSQGDGTYKDCEYGLSYKTTGGELLGSAGGPGTSVAGIDFGVTDKNKRALNFIRPSAQPDTTRFGQCALDYFSEPLRAQLYAKLPRQAEPRCGQIMQDKAGTLQGDWFLKGGSANTWAQQFAMLHNNVDPSVGVVSVGGTISGAGNFNFTPTHSGLINRGPSEIMPGSTIYCYQGETLGNAQAGLGQTSGSVLLQLTDSTTLKVEHQSSNCTAPFTFRSPTTYIR